MDPILRKSNLTPKTAYSLHMFGLSVFIISLITLQFPNCIMTADANVVSAEKQIIVVFRFDDYSTPTNTNIEGKIIKAFQKHNVSCTFGVIPYYGGQYNALSQMKANILANAIKSGTIEVALHGFDHISIRKERKSEFFGLDFATQFEKIAKGNIMFLNLYTLRGGSSKHYFYHVKPT